MKASKFSEAPIAFVLKQAEDGTAIGKAGILERLLQLAQAICRSEAVRGETAASAGVRPKLKRIVADLSLDKVIATGRAGKKL